MRQLILIFGTDLTDKYHLIIPGRKYYDTKHHDGVVIKNCIKHYIMEYFAKDNTPISAVE